jgi:Polyketide cyclase / dehydrase and lipid transport
MKLILFIGGGAVALIIVVLIIGALLPREHVASREIVLRRPPSEIYATLREFASAPKWRPNVHRVDMLDDVDGRVRFREYARHSRITYELVEDSPHEKLITRIVDQDLGYSGTWTYLLSPTNGGTRLRITENGDVSNALFRFMSRFAFGHTAAMDAYLRALARKFGEEAQPE